MKKIVGTLALFLFAAPLIATAHERQEFIIGGERYQFVVGSLNEPVTVDDKTGVDLRVSRVDRSMMDMEGHDHESAEGAVAGLEETLQVELVAGDKKKTLDFSPVYNTPGAYKAPFYPTVATTLSYRVFGTLNDTSFDYTFTCNPAGHDVTPEDDSRVEVSDGVFRIHKSGAFGCPVEKASMGFPEASADIASLKADAQNGTVVAWGAGALALVALALAFRRRS